MQEHHHSPSPAPQPSTQPTSGPHPEEIDPLGRAHKHDPLAPEEKRVVSLLVVALVTFALCAPIIAVISDSPLLNVLLGLSPLFITIIIDIALTTQHYKVVTLWIVLVLVHIFMMGVLWGLNFVLSDKVNLSGSIGTSTILAVIVTVIVMLADAKRVGKSVRETKEHTVPFKPEKINEYISAIEDKAKALNFVIGRVYRSSNGGSVAMRERLRIPSEWYNEFNAIRTEDLDTQLGHAAILVRKIRDRLMLYAQKEKDVFSKSEINGLKHIVRNKDGEDPVIDVLKTNDRDPVDHYYVSAVDFCDRILSEIEKK
jgi:hypothetical protein